MSDTVFDEILREQKVEPVGSDVFHLVQFPRSDREELLGVLTSERLQREYALDLRTAVGAGVGYQIADTLS